MGMARLTGQGAASRKYDLLAVLGTAGLSGSPIDQRRALRLISLLTARYDWRADRLSTGQREIARLWSVDERTVKREMAHFRDCGWLVLKRQGGRGHVAQYGLGLEKILSDTREHWTSVGSDFVDRLTPVPEFTPVPSASLPPPEGNTPWDMICAAVARDSPSTYATWLRPLTPVRLVGEELCLKAPSRFHASYVQTHHMLRLQGLCRSVAPMISTFRIEVD